MKEEILKKIMKSKKNLIINGSISTGKTTSIGMPLVKRMIDDEENLLIVDPKEEYLNQYYDLLKEKDYNIIIINHRNLKKSEGWNILEYPYNLYKNGQIDKSIDYLEQIGDELFSENSNDPFWMESAKRLFTGVVLGLFEDGREDEININSVSNMINSSSERNGANPYLTDYFLTKNPFDIAYRCASGTVFAAPITRESIISVAKQKLCLLTCRELLNQQLNRTTFNFDDIVNKKTAIFFITMDESKYLNTLVPIFIRQLFSILIDKCNKNKFNFILDNFDSIDYVSELSTILGSGIARNIKFTIITRSKQCFEEQYGKYINSLVNEINVSENKLEFLVDNEKLNCQNNYSCLNLKNANIEYPNLVNSNFRIFDLKNYVLERQKKKPKDPNYKDGNFDIDKVLNELDIKIAEIEKEEQKAIKNEIDNKELKSDFEEFKVND